MSGTSFSINTLGARLAVPLLCAFCFAGQGHLDGIVAVVGDEAILRSDLDAYVVLRLAGQNSKVDSATLPEYRKQFLGELIDGKVLVAHAKADTTIVVTDEELNRALDNQIQSILKQNNLNLDGLEAALQREQGISLAKFKAEARTTFREQILKQKVQRQYLASIKATRRDVEEFYATYHDSLQKAGESVLLSRLAMSGSAPAPVRQAAWDKITSIKQRLDKGENFADLAKQYSESPEAESGGDLGFVEKGSLNLIAFEEQAFATATGRTSEPFATKLGFHIVNVLARQADRVHVRQIFIKVAPPPEEAKRIAALLDSLRQTCVSNEAFTVAVKKFSTDENSRVRGGLLGWKSVITLAGPVQAAIDSLPAGTNSPVVDEGNESAVYRIVDRVKERALTLEDDWQVLADKAQDIMAQKKLIELVSRWRHLVYIDIRL